MKSCVILSPVFLALATAGVLCLVGCDAGKPRSSAPIVEDKPVVPPPEPAKPIQEPERELVNVGENPSGKADFAKDGDKHIMAPILVPLGAYFTVQERLKFMQVDHAMNLYKAAHDNKPPASHEEFEKEILQANGITLPSLKKQGDRYQFDPESGELKISTVKQ